MRYIAIYSYLAFSRWYCIWWYW